jgi:sugar transferase (PEP-CTERM/EpsH1 system associated)
VSGTPLIAHIVVRFDYGGLENGVANVVNGLSGGEYRHAVIALTEATSFRERLRDGISVYALGKRPGKDPAAYIRLFRLLRKLEPAVVHSRNVGTLDCVVVAFLAGVPFRIHGEHGWDVYDPEGKRLKYRVLRRLVSHLVHRFVTVSEELRQWLVEVVGLPAGKVTRICNGVDTSKFRPRDAAAPPSRLPGAMRVDGAVVIGTVTRFSAIKDPLNLVDAFIRLRAAIPQITLRLVMIGDGELRADALARLEAAGAADAAWLPGARDDVQELLSDMDVFVLGSLREGISNTVLEAMASGVPVIATATGGNGELIESGRTGELVPVGDAQALADAIRRYAADRQLRARHGKQARERAVAQFSLAGMVNNYRRLYDELLGSARGGACAGSRE